MKCPVCKKKTNLKDNPYRPFCSKECKFADLYNWLNEEYKIKEEIEWLEKNLPKNVDEVKKEE
ncbi:DNA gyrase inhibitor YacG [Thermodesulfobacterium sp. TA1]|uniref:DNA gyrase inhibitor YacG n=1 Tax=Thermodesulfobacterium sp. TA1 TaxID=2234087 RepID=UPI001232A92C|nr:DNA gyrase inhibitor YacG [Thermodesulfobacterium sp. TA1]QER41558.1 DNA gyrase inhibitor YacG [Thermodesulfobacterium sp. TA1]